MLKHQRQLEINWFPKRAGLVPGKRNNAKAVDKNFSDDKPREGIAW